MSILQCQQTSGRCPTGTQHSSAPVLPSRTTGCSAGHKATAQQPRHRIHAHSVMRPLACMEVIHAITAQPFMACMSVHGRELVPVPCLKDRAGPQHVAVPERSPVASLASTQGTILVVVCTQSRRHARRVDSLSGAGLCSPAGQGAT